MIRVSLLDKTLWFGEHKMFNAMGATSEFFDILQSHSLSSAYRFFVQKYFFPNFFELATRTLFIQICIYPFYIKKNYKNKKK